jgi:Zn-dependent peptidase ImmA (M78 family)/DNA-binding XRE family transcriptional regulator
MSDEEFNPQRLALARRRRGLTMTKLATRVGVQPRSISAYENGEFAPSDETLAELSKHLRFPVNFFFGPDLDVPDTRSASFRALSRMTAGERDAALGAGALALALNDRLDGHFDLSTPDLPDLHAEDPEAAADIVRSEWMLGYRAVPNLIHLLELKGVRVYSLTQDTRNVDAFSFWRNATPFVFLDRSTTAERVRFDAAHELGHLVLHKHGGPVGQDAETQANAFASAFLMPASSVFAAVRQAVTLRRLIQLKKRWGVSIQALAYRLHKLHVLTDWQYRSMCIEMAPFRRTEPEPMEHEASQVLGKMFAVLQDEGLTKMEIAKKLSISRADLESLTFGMDVAHSDHASGRSGGTRASLTLVK